MSMVEMLISELCCAIISQEIRC